MNTSHFAYYFNTEMRMLSPRTTSGPWSRLGKEQEEIIPCFIRTYVNCWYLSGCIHFDQKSQSRPKLPLVSSVVVTDD